MEKQIRGIIEAIKEGMFQPSMKAEMDALEARKKELTELLADIPEDVPDLLPSASAVYAKKVGVLTGALNRPDERPQAAETLRVLIEKIVLTPGPERGEILATLHGELRTILEWIDRQAIPFGEDRDATIAELTELLTEVRRTDVARVHGAWKAGLFDIAVPLRKGGEVVAAVNVSGPSERFDAAAMDAFLIPLKRSAREMERTLSGGL